VSVGDKISIDFIEVYSNMNSKESILLLSLVSFGSWGIVDVFSFSNDNPYRIEFWKEVDSIRSFDVGTQLSIEIQKIIPNVENKIFRRTESFLDYISEKTVILSKIRRLLSQLDKQFSKQKRLSKTVKET
jgi:transcription-repair coupling factor (superfamily II helicase)